MEADRVSRFLEAWESPNIEKESDCLPDSLLLAIAAEKIQDPRHQIHIQECEMCGTVVKLLRETLREPGKNLHHLINQAKKEADDLESKRSDSIWKRFSVRQRLVPIAATLAVVVAVIWGPVLKNRLPKDNQAQIRLGTDNQFAPAMKSFEEAAAVLTTPDASEQDKRATMANLRERLKKLRTVDSDKLTQQQVDVLNAQTANLQALYTSSVLRAAMAKKSQPDLQLDVYSAYAKYKTAAEANGERQIIIPTLDPENVVKEIYVSTDPSHSTVIVEPRSSQDLGSSQWFGSAMQSVADQKGVRIELQSGKKVLKQFQPESM